MVFVIVVVAMVVAARRCRGQMSAQVGGDERFDRSVRYPSPHGDTMLREVGQRPAADAARDDDLDASLAQPARKQARLVFGCRDNFRVQ